MKKIYFFLSVLFILLAFFTFIFSKAMKAGTVPKYQEKLWGLAFNNFMEFPDILKSSFMILSGKRSFSNLFNDYNVKFLPETQYIKLNYNKKLVNAEIKNDINGRRSFFIDIFQDELFLVTKDGKFFKSSLKQFLKTNDPLQVDKIKVQNLFKDSKNKINIFDILIVDEKIYLSLVYKSKDCEKLYIVSAKISNELQFRTLKEFSECIDIGMSGGRIQKYEFKSKKGILITTGDQTNDNPGLKAQDDNSIFGKILFLDLKDSSYEIFSKGHRNAQGLAVRDEKIISTEHGPKGGDEINIINYKKNYGWPVASYGFSYEKKDLVYKKSHETNFFEEPIFVFLPSIGISEVIFLPNNFDVNWSNNIIVSSLNDRSIYRIKFQNEKFDKILYSEKIYIGERIRDIKYYEKSNLIILSLERTGSIGVLSRQIQ